MNFSIFLLIMQFSINCFCQKTGSTTNKIKTTTPALRRLLNSSEPVSLREKGLTFAILRTTTERTTSTTTRTTKTPLTTKTSTTKTPSTIQTTVTSTTSTSTTSLTTETQTTTPRPTIPFCDLTWKRYDPFYDPHAPEKDGLLLGNYIDGSPIYVGRGSSTYFRKYTFPARVYINESNSKSGIYVVSYPNEFCDTSGTAEYLVTNPDYDYKWIASSEGQMEMNAVGWANSRINISVARINLTRNDGTEISQIGASVVSLGTIYYDPVKDVIGTMGLRSYEALICVPKSVKYESDFCAFEWKLYDPLNNPNAPATDGILIGNYYDNTPIYLGRGNDICEAISPARVNIVNDTQSPGVYTSCDGIELVDTSMSAEYLVKNPDYTYFWVKASSNDKILNAVKWRFLADTLAVSRIKIYNKKTKSRFVTIGKTFVGVGTWYYNPLTNYTDSVGMQDVEILLCSPNNSTKPIEAPIKGCVHEWKRFSYRSKNISQLEDGIIAGSYVDGSPFYVGAGFQLNTSDIVPARVIAANSSKPGVYVCVNGYEYIDRKSSAQYLVYNDSQVRG
ncbi:hypothetical protein ACKWTF_016260 [Chironomus riparius]